MAAVPQAMVDQVRSFNRAVTQRIGALDDRYLGRHRPLGQDRVLWEIGTEGCEVRTLRTRLGLDAGHASRLLRALECSGLITTEPSPGDGRVRVARLSSAGQAERSLLVRRSDALASSILAPLDPRQRHDLLTAMGTVRRLLTTAEVEIRRVDPAGADAVRCMSAYFAELGRRSNGAYDPSAGVSAEPDELTPPAGLFLVAYVHGEAVGCGGIKHHPDEPSEIKRMWVAEGARGLGIARRMLTELEAEARRSGAQSLRLETNRSLVEAIEMYRKVGYAEVAPFNDEPFAHHWFEKPL
ncbi:MAG: MarR family transcriptional regulator [Solirubrobacterales bacterium]|nr:MarR family transcriptional regulator [Solirubrobacterales bacterium]MBV9942364.1 MarR family transcriptional regulator [Solirubrobacterales bacterium]